MPAGVQAKGDPIPSPFVYQADDYAGKLIRITIPFSLVTGLLLAGTGHKDPGCMYNTIVFGPPSEPGAIRIPIAEGDSLLLLPLLGGLGLVTLTDLTTRQVTAEP